MFVISKDIVTQVESKPLMVTEASTAGLGIGFWPRLVAVLDDQDEGFMFFLDKLDESGGHYSTKNGSLQLLVFND